MVKRALILLAACFAAALLFVQSGGVSAESGWRGEYYDNEWFAGDPVFTRIDPEINFDWGAGSPDPRIPVDNFSVRWRRTFWADSAGSYRFTIKVDDTLRIWVNGSLEVDITEATDISQLAPTFDVDFRQGNNYVYIEYKEDSFPARVTVIVERNDGTPAANPLSGGWLTEYFDNAYLNGDPVYEAFDAAPSPYLAVYWSEGSPRYGTISNDYFSTRWTRTILVQEDTYADMRVNGDDKVRVLLDGVEKLQLSEPWSEVSTRFFIKAGQYELVVEHQEFEYSAFVSFNLGFDYEIPPPPPPPPPPLPAIPEPTVHYFTSSHTDIEFYETMTLRWRVTNAETVGILAGGAGYFGDLPLEGELTLNSGEICFGSSQILTLFATDPHSERVITDDLTVTMPEPSAFFFSNPPAYNPCTTPLNSLAAQQTFEGGTMVWHAKTKQIFAMYYDETGKPSFSIFTDTFDQAFDAESDPSLTPPDGKLQPIRGFGKVWRSYPDIRERLGWATSAETAYDTTYQWGRDLLGHKTLTTTDRFYFVSSDDQLWVLSASLTDGIASNYWYKTPFSYAR